MLIVLSPAKTLDYETPASTDSHSQPRFLPDSRLLVRELAAMAPADIAGLMGVSDQLAALNVARFAAWKTPFTPRNARQAVLAFDGDVYDGLAARELDEDALQWAQAHLRILSGLYGLLRPLDLMQPYRLEMGTRLANERGANLYAFWSDRIARVLDRELRAHEHRVLVNLASEEYFRAVDRRALRHRVVQPVFQERRGAGWRVISFNAKRARGRMARYAIERRVVDPQRLKAFDLDGYRYADAASDASTWVFRRDA